MSRKLATLGDALDVAVINAEQEGRRAVLPEFDQQLALCMIRTHRTSEKRGLLTVSARERVTGDIIVGPYATRSDKPTEEHLLKYMRAHRWVLSPVVMGDGKAGADGSVKHPRGTIAGHPSICVMNRVRTVCPKCGLTADEWKDELIIRSKAYADHGIIAGWSPEMVSVCRNKECSCMLTQTKLRSTAVESREGHNDDPVVSKEQRDKVIAVMLNAWQAGPPADGKATVTLPRLWAVYPLTALPDTSWQPTDERATNLVQKAGAFQMTYPGTAMQPEPYPLGILPYGQAKKFHMAPEPLSTGVKEFWLESDEVVVGWANLSQLCGTADLGYRRELWSEPPKRTGSRSPGRPAPRSKQRIVV